MNKKTTYKDAGVDIDAGMESLRRIKSAAVSTHTSAVLSGLGTFGSLYDLKKILADYKEPVLVQSVDGVGTKLMVANMTGQHGSVGFDIVNHSCNDILCQGAKPLTFLDYIASESLQPAQVEELVGGMASACREAGVALVGGETAELPGTYRKGEYDLVGIITGVVEKSKIITGKDISQGDVIVGLASNGLHTNGYTLARKVIFEKMSLSVDDTPAGLGSAVGDALMEPHKNYATALWPLLQDHPVKGLAHITGGGLVDNIPRILPDNTDAVIEKSSWETPPLFRIIQEGAGVPESDMLRTFNMGIGMVIVIDSDHAENFKNALEKSGETVYMIGAIENGTGKVRLV
ncbi:Phosphoribosylformylglycinamidine cyclo-ligase [hydrothermal vent metagenome]|uniref:Phosphoribosylformylglycinamidine cyclo-ligase n=1 Tax=hydrothermal vent metagenome TaxID=652676 RepID=A0A3B1CEG7_9ZZZZ